MRVICSIHPRYLGKRKPTSNCICCNTMWEMVNKPACGAHPGGYTTLFGYDDRSSMRIVPEINSIRCKDCTEPFSALGREKICPECREEREIYKEESRESRMQK